MADIICISKETYIEGINNIGDIVDVLEDGKADGDAYKTFDIIHVDGKAEDIKKQLRAKIPKMSTVTMWQDPKTLEWFKIDKQPKYLLTAIDVKDSSIKTEEIDNIKDTITTNDNYKSEKVVISNA